MLMDAYEKYVMYDDVFEKKIRGVFLGNLFSKKNSFWTF